MTFRSFVVCLIFLLAGHSALAAMTSSHYQIGWDDLSAGGAENATSSNFSVNDTLGSVGSGQSSSSNYGLSTGYRASEAEGMLSLVFKGQTNSSKTDYTGFSLIGKTVTVSSISPFTTGTRIAVVENIGFSEKIAVGQIVGITGNVLSVDGWSGDQASMSALPAGGDDYVFALNSAVAAFGTVSAATENTATAVTEVRSRVASGYTVYVQADQTLQNGTGHEVNSVLDGTVSLGSEEYGISVTGTRAYGAGMDQAVTTTQRIIQTSGTVTGSVPDRVAEVYKLAITGSTPAGTYGQNVYYTLTANF